MTIAEMGSGLSGVVLVCLASVVEVGLESLVVSDWVDLHPRSDVAPLPCSGHQALVQLQAVLALV